VTRVLVIDHEETLRSELRAPFAELGFDVLEAASVRDAAVRRLGPWPDVFVLIADHRFQTHELDTLRAGRPLVVVAPWPASDPAAAIDDARRLNAQAMLYAPTSIDAVIMATVVLVEARATGPTRVRGRR